MANGQFQTPADMLASAQDRMYLLLTGQAEQAIENPQLGRVQFHGTTATDLQRLIDYLQNLVANGNVWPDPSNPMGSMTAGATTGRKPFSFLSWP